ncbi:unnamed protein product [Effrenium voratum]|nr:unnamed protein product [Effrenium voratum]
MDFEVLASALPAKARVVLVGPHAVGAGKEPSEELLGPELRADLEVSVFPQTYQRFMACQEDLPPPQLVVLFHPGFDVHYFAWYSCLRHWAEQRVPVLATAYRVPGGLGETPQTVRAFLECLVGTGGGAGLWVMEEENPHAIEEGSFNAGYFVTLGSQGALPVLAEEMYWPLYQALQKLGHPFAPRVGYLDLEHEQGKVSSKNLNLLAAIAEGAMRGAQAGEDGADEEAARGFAAMVLDQVIGAGAGQTWLDSGFVREACPSCGAGFDSREWHVSVCPAAGKTALRAGEEVLVVGLEKVPQLNGQRGELRRFVRPKERWVVAVKGREALFKAANLKAA